MPLSSPGSKLQRLRRGSSKPIQLGFAATLGFAIVLGISVAWTPQFWGVAVLHSGILVTACAWLFFADDWKFPSASIFVSVIAVWGWLQLAVFGSTARASTRTVSLEWTVAAVAFCLACQILRHSKARNLFLAVMMWAVSAFSILAVLQMYSSPNEVLWLFPAQPNTVGTFLYKNQFVVMIELAMPIALYSILFRKEQRFWGAVAFVALFAGAVASGSRAGATLVLLECVIALLLASRAGKLKLLYAVAVIPAAVLLLGATAVIAGNDQVWAHFQEVHPDAARQELFQSTIRMFKSEPWSGYGLGAWPGIYPAYATFDVGRVANSAHNDWMEWASEGGVIFVGSFLAIMLLSLRPALGSVWGLGVIAVMLHSWVDYPIREPVLGVFWFCMVGALLSEHRTVERRKTIPATDY